MNSEIAKERISYVARPDSITTSDGDFLATHVALRKLKVLDKFDMSPTGGKDFSEEEVFKQFVLNPDDHHQFIAVYGQSGTGKSHLIRWLATRFEQNKSNDEVVLFIRRSDNTLKGTIRQLLEKPEVQGINNREIYERLVKAAVSVEENELKDHIYHSFIIKIDNDLDDHDITLGSVMKKKLVAFLSNDIVHDYLMKKDGPIERMYSKIAEHSMVDRDTVAQFEQEDFMVSQDLYDNILAAGSDLKAGKMARELLSDEKGPRTAKTIAEYLNQFRNDVIQRCAGIEPGDFKQIFMDIRKELFRLDKKLTLFVEDVTSFTGVDTALLDALIEEHTGKRDGDDICRISSVVGTTNNYLQKNFKDNHKDRITKYIYIPSDVLDERGLYEFVSKYINTMSLDEETINEWVMGHANPEDYPIHNVIEGKNWELVDIGNGKELNIYPFTKRSILYFYNNVLEKGHQTPRYIIRDIIEPVVRDAIFNKNKFPSIDINLINTNIVLNNRIHYQITDNQMADRLLKFVSVWGDGTTNQYTDGKTTYIAGITKEQYADFNLPLIKMDEVAAPKSGEKPKEEPKEQKKKTDEETVLEAKKKKVNEVNTLLTKWSNTKKIDISAMGGAAGKVHIAVYDDIPNYLYTSINWQAEGISLDNVRKVNDASVLLVALEGQTKNEGLIEIPATWDSIGLILAFVRWNEYGNKSWNYPDSDYDAFLITTWTESVKANLVKKVSEYKDGVLSNYIEAAVAAEIYRIILHDELMDKTLDHFNSQALFTSKPRESVTNCHSKEWKSLVSMMSQKKNDLINQETVRRYFNIEQSGARSITVLDPIKLECVLNKDIKQRLKLSDDEKQNDDLITQRRNAFTLLSDIEERIDSVAKAEQSIGRELLQVVFNAFGEEVGEEELEELIDRIKKFYDEANKTMINVKEVSLESIRDARKIQKAIEDIDSVSSESDTLSILLAFSGDPISSIKPLVDIINSLEVEVEKANKQIENKLSSLGSGSEDNNLTDRYAAELASIKASKEKLEGRCKYDF